MPRGYAVGIDFGTTNSVVGHGTAATAEVLPTASGHRTVPSVVAVTDDGALVGREATNWEARHPDEVVRSVKREMGEDRVVLSGSDGTGYAPEQVAALVLSRLKRQAEERLDGPVTNAVLSVPSYFGHRQREATRRAGEIAGLTVDRLVTEPTAACLAYGVGNVGGGGVAETVLVYDLGGGTFDVSLVTVNEGVFDVVATDGDTALGGDDWDERIVSWVLDRPDVPDAAIEDDPVAMARLRAAARRAKHDLSSNETTTLRVPHLPDEYTLEVELTRDRFEELAADLREETLDVCEDLLAATGWNAWTIDEILLVGGATRMPQIRDAVRAFFGEIPSREVKPEQVVARGAAIQAAIVDGGEVPDASHERTASGRTDGGTTDPDVVVVDAVPKSLGIETSVDGERGHFSPIIEHNTSIPTSRTEQYRTSRDGQDRIRIRVYQGESEMVEDNEFLAELELVGLPDAPAGEVVASVTFEVDENGVLDVTATETETGASGELTVDAAFERVDQDVRRMRAELPERRSAE